MVLRKADEYQVDPENPWASDKLDRKKVADYLTPVIASVTQPFTISLHSPYGTGKTSFIKSWQAALREDGYKTVYFNAWETDFSRDAFVAFMAAIQMQLAEDKTVSESVKESIGSAARMGVWSLTKALLPVVAKGLAKKAIGHEAVEDVLDAVGTDAEEIGSAAGNLVTAAIETQAATMKLRDDFREGLAQAISGLFGQDLAAEKKKLIVFVDELDRCRPNYAVELLEAIKHLFSVDGLLFILAIDRVQLLGAIGAVYGANCDARGYLDRFIDWQFKLPVPKLRNFVDFLSERYELAKIPMPRRDGDLYDVGSLVDALVGFGNAYDISLRRVEKIFTEINVFVRSLGQNQCPFYPVIGALSVLRVADPNGLEKAQTSGQAAIEYCSVIREKLFNAAPSANRNSVGRMGDDLLPWFLGRANVSDLTDYIEKIEKQLAVQRESGTVDPNLEKDIERRKHQMEYWRYISRQYNFDDPPVLWILGRFDFASQVSA
jgi:hypothetical protein